LHERKINKYLSFETKVRETIADKSICNYICYDDEKSLHYIAINIYRDIFGDNYAKPLYVEDKPYSNQYLPDCRKTKFRDIPYISLIKNTKNQYRLNKDIYSDAVNLLGLEREEESSLAFNLVKIPKKHIIKIIHPSIAYSEAIKINPLIRRAIKMTPLEHFCSRVEIGLVGSIAFDSNYIAPDIDLVFSGDASEIHKIYSWFRQSKVSTLAPLQRKIKRINLLLCSFFSLESQYPANVAFLRIKNKELTRESVKIIRSINYPFVNLQCYKVLRTVSKSELELWVRDTLGRCILNTDDEIKIDAYESECLGREVLFLTDVEQQLHGKKVHFA
jgi:hypothetical protein